MGWNSLVVIANKVIVQGTEDGVFVYSGTPALGNPPVAWMASGTHDPFGNPLAADAAMGITGTATFAAGDTIIYPGGTVTYSGTPAAGNMLSSSAPAAFTDAFGNKVLSGTAVYDSSLALVMVPASTNLLTFTNSSGQAGTWTAQALFQLPADDTGQTPAQLEPGSIALQNSGAPLVTNIPAGSTVLYSSSHGRTGEETSAYGGLAPLYDTSLTDTSTISSGNVTSATDITHAFPTDTGNGATAGTVYELSAEFGGTWGQALTFYADINGTKTALATIGAAFGASGDTIGGWLELEVRVVSSSACRLALRGAIVDQTTNSGKLLSGSNNVAIGMQPLTGVAFAAGDTVALAVAFAGSVAGQTVNTDGSTFTRKA